MKVDTFIDNTKEVMENHFTKTCQQRLAGGAGSYYEGINSPEELEEALRKACWHDANHADVAPGCRALISVDMPTGKFGMMRLDELPQGTTIQVIDPKETGYSSLAVRWDHKEGRTMVETWMILGYKDNREVILTFHPGPPINPDKVRSRDLKAGSTITREKAMEMGFVYAKILNPIEPKEPVYSY